MTTFVLGSFPASSFELIQLFNDEEFRTANGAPFFNGRNGNRWELVINWNNLWGSDRRNMWATLIGLNGKRHRLRIYPATHLGYSFSGVGDSLSPVSVIRLQGPHTAGATQLTVDQMSINTPGFIQAGDFVRILNELKMVTADVDTNESGEGTLEIWPELHADQNDNQEVFYADEDVYGDFFLMESTFPAEPFRQQASNSKWLSSLTVRLEEDVSA